MASRDEATPASVRTEICEGVIESHPLFNEISADENGALNLFLGVTRDHHQGREVTGLEYHCYLPMAEAKLKEIAQAVAQEYEITRFVVLHRIGNVGIGETSLAVAAGAHHRRNALLGTLEFIDRLKRDVPIWKKESFADASVGWVEGDQITPSQPSS